MTHIYKHIEDYLLYYLKSEFNPEFAVLLQGEWGCGKTWFIEKFIEKHSEPGGFSFLYITLYGVTKYSEIDDQIFRQLHPALSKPSMILAGKVLKGALKGGLKIDLSDESSINAKMDDIGIPGFLKKAEKCILVFDDIERSDISIKNILGYINSFVEHQKLRVILIANEEQLHIREESENDNGLYRSIKDKLIGKTFKINHDFDSAFNDFTAQIQNVEISGFIKSEQQVIFEIFDTARFHNLRHLKQSLWDLERFYNSIPDKYKDNFKLLAEFLPIFLALSFEIKSGNIQPNHIREMESFYAREIASIRENPGLKAESHPIDNVLEKYSFLRPFETLFPAQFWSDLFENGYLPESELTLYFEECRYYIDEDTPAWVKLWHFEELEDDEFEELLKDIFSQMRDGKISEPGEILHVCGLVLRFSHNGLLSKSPEEALDVCMEFIDRVREKESFKNILPQDIYNRREKDSYDGLGYAGRELEEFNTIEEYLKEKIIESNRGGLPKAGSDFLELLEKDPDEACKIVSFHETDYSIYKYPVFKYVTPIDFYEIFIKLKNPEKRNVIDSFEIRYKEHLNDDLYDELSFIISLNMLIREEAKKNEGRLSGYILDICEEKLSSAIEHIENYRKTDG